MRELLRQFHDLVVEVRLFSCLHHLLVRSFRIAVEDVLLNRAVKNVVLLQHQPDVLAQILRVVVLQIDPVEGDGAHLWLVEFVQQVDNRTLARTREPDQRCDLARLNLHIDAEQSLRAVRVGEIDTLQLEVAVYGLRSVLARRLDLLFGVEDAEETLRVDQRVVHIIEDALQLCDGRDDIAEQHHMVHDLTDGHARIFDEHQVGGEDDDQHGTHLSHEALETVVVESYPAGFHLVLCHLVLNVQLFLPLDLLTVETFDNIDGVDDVLDTLTFRLQMAAHLAPPALEPPRLPVGDPEVNRHDAEGDQTNIDIGCEHQYEGEQGAGEQRQQVDEEVLHRARQ